MKEGQRIRFLQDLEEDATGDHPRLQYAKRGEMGTIVRVGCCIEGFWVKTDTWPNAFGASQEEFECIDI